MTYDARDVFFLMNKGVSAIITKPGKKCRKAMRRMDRAFKPKAATKGEAEQLVTLDTEARIMFRVRCGLCKKRCEKPLT